MKQKGGKILGKGTYGAAVSPARFCPDVEHMESDIRYISKIFYGKNASKDRDAEWEILQMMKNIDPDEIFTIEPLETCDIPSKGDSELLSITDKELVPEIVLKFGGSEIHDLVNDETYKIPYGSFIKSFEILFRGISLMHKKHFVHRDIKPPNLLYSSDQKAFYLIDFGLTCLDSQVYDKENSFILNYQYPYYPPEFQFIGGLQDSESIQTVDHIIQWLKSDRYPQIADFCLSNVESSKLENALHSKNPSIYREQLYTFLHNFRTYLIRHKSDLEQLSKNKLLKHAFTPSAHKADIYGLGVTFSTLHYTKKIAYENETQRLEFETLLGKMKHMDPSERFSANDVLEYITKSSQQSGGGTMNNEESPVLPTNVRENQIKSMKKYLQKLNEN